MAKLDPFNIDKAYVSPYDQFLAAFDRTHEPSASQKAEQLKHEKIAKHRDVPQATAFDEDA